MADDANLLTARQVELANFDTSLRGYDVGEVDALMARVTEALNRHESGRRSEPDTIATDRVRSATLSTAFGGYHLEEVDDFLDDVVAALHHYEFGGRRLEDQTDQPAQQVRTRSAPFKRRASLPSRARRPQPSPSDIEADSERSASIPDDEVVEVYRARSSDELLEQAKKWLDRS